MVSMTRRARNVSTRVTVSRLMTLLRGEFAPGNAFPVRTVFTFLFGHAAPVARADADPELFRLQVVLNADQTVAGAAPAAVPDRLQGSDGSCGHDDLLPSCLPRG